MAKPHVVDVSEQTRVPFLRGILTRSLQDAGLPFQDAYDVASQVRDDMADQAEIKSDDLRELVKQVLEQRFGTETAERYRLSRQRAPAPILVESGDGAATPFSRGSHMLFLEASGLKPRQAAAVTSRVYEHLLNEDIKQITTNHLAYLTYLALGEFIGDEAADRYRVWHEFQNSDRPLLILIGGTVGCGKSTVSTALAHKLDIVRIQSTDMLREVMRMMMPERLSPVLHTSSFNAWRKQTFAAARHADHETVVEGFQSQARLLAVAGEAVLNRARTERVSLILEGVHIQPAFAASLSELEDAVIVPVLLGVLKHKELRKRIQGRGTQAPRRRAQRYLGEFESIWELQSFLLSEADRCDVPIISNLDREKAVQEIIRVVIDRLAKEFVGEPRTVFGIDVFDPDAAGDSGEAPVRKNA